MEKLWKPIIMNLAGGILMFAWCMNPSVTCGLSFFGFVQKATVHADHSQCMQSVAMATLTQ